MPYDVDLLQTQYAINPRKVIQCDINELINSILLTEESLKRAYVLDFICLYALQADRFNLDLENTLSNTSLKVTVNERKTKDLTCSKLLCNHVWNESSIRHIFERPYINSLLNLKEPNF